MMVRSYRRLANKFDQKETWFFVEKKHDKCRFATQLSYRPLNPKNYLNWELNMATTLNKSID